MAISSSIGCVLVITLCGFGGEVGLPLLAPFAITFGLAAGGFSSMWSQSAHGIAGPDKELQTLLVAGKQMDREWLRNNPANRGCGSKDGPSQEPLVQRPVQPLVLPCINPLRRERLNHGVRQDLPVLCHSSQLLWQSARLPVSSRLMCLR